MARLDNKALESLKWRIKSTLLVTLLALPAFSQVTVNATLTDGSGNTSPQGYLHFELYNCGYNYPVVRNSVMTPTRNAFDIKPGQPSGQISIVAGSTTASTLGYPN
jgi:hypothetical protein